MRRSPRAAGRFQRQVEEQTIARFIECGDPRHGFARARCDHNRVRVAADDAEGRRKLAGYMLRAPLSLAKMSYDAANGTVIYRSIDALGTEEELPGHARRQVAGAALQAYPRPLRAIGALLRMVLEPQLRGAGGKGRCFGDNLWRRRRSRGKIGA